ncbi:hypothetical protein MA16_Dca025871 [Dendrobium catenatum]|uniref:Uncharacterized protein n=1 Tax=Dendrobium catenatum TaxID=906689 RepID=A0A2I0WWB4_9ASPA|nr:hypothetical protein MA16_Dca025871 [Dendrobium catenatum]
MDSKAQRKALFRSRLRETSQKREKRIDSPLVRYNYLNSSNLNTHNFYMKCEL